MYSNNNNNNLSNCPFRNGDHLWKHDPLVSMVSALLAVVSDRERRTAPHFRGTTLRLRQMGDPYSERLSDSRRSSEGHRCANLRRERMWDRSRAECSERLGAPSADCSMSRVTPSCETSSSCSSNKHISASVCGDDVAQCYNGIPEELNDGDAFY